MKLMVSLVLAVVVCHAADSSRNRREEEDKAAKRQLLEGNFGLRLQHSIEGAFAVPQAGYDGNKNDIREGPPQTEYGPPQQTVAKLSDVLTGQGPSVPDAIQSHLYSPVQVYQPRLGSPTTFEVSPPVSSQLAYSEHKIYQAAPTAQTFNGIQDFNPHIQPQLPDQPQQIQIHPFPGLGQLQPTLHPRPDLPNEFLPHLNTPSLPPNPNFPQRIYQQVFSEQNGVIPQDIFQQINQLGSQMNFDESDQQSQVDNKSENEGSINVEQQQDLLTGIQYANRAQNAAVEKEQQEQKVDEQGRRSQQQSFITQQPQAVSYVSFSQSLPDSSKDQYESQQDQTRLSLKSPRPHQELPQPQSPPQFQPAQATITRNKSQSLFQPIGTTPLPRTTIYTTVNQTPHRIGVVKIRPKPDSITSEPFTVSTAELQGSSTSTATVVPADENSQSTFRPRKETTKFTTPVPRSRPTFRSFSRPTLAPRSTQQTFSQSQRTFAPRTILSPLLRRRTTLHTFSTLPSSTISPLSVVAQSSSTLPPELSVEIIPSQPPRSVTEILPSLPPQSVTEPLPFLPSQSTLQTLPTSTPQPQLVQSTLTPIPLFTPEQIQSISLQQQYPTTLQPLQSLSTLLPVPVTEPQSLPSTLQLDVPQVSPILALSQPSQLQSKPHTVIQDQEFKSEEKLQQQLLQSLPQQPQLQWIQVPQQIQQQLQSIQQQLQLLQQQPFIQQQPQPVQIIQQQSSTPFPPAIQFAQQQTPQQPVQFIQQQLQPFAGQQLLQLIQQQPLSDQPQPQSVTPQRQLIQPPPILIQPQPQLIQPQPQLIQPQSQLIQVHPQIIQPSSTPQPHHQSIEHQQQMIETLAPPIQEQPQPIPSQPQLIHSQTQPTQTTPEPIQLLSQPQLISIPPPVIQMKQQQHAPSLQSKIESQQDSLQEEINHQNEDKSVNLEGNESNKSNEDEEFYNQLLNNIYSDEFYASLRPSHPLFPVPVAFPSYQVTPLPALHSPLHSTLHSSPLHASSLHSHHLHSPTLHDHPYYSSHSLPSVQYYGKYANGIFGGGWR